MKLSRIVAASSLVILFAAGSVSARSIEAKSIEIDGSLLYQHTSVSVDVPGAPNYGVTFFNLNAQGGYFLNPRIEILGGLMIDHTSAFYGAGSTTGFGLTGGGRYHFPTTGDIIPFAGASLSLVSHSNGLDTEFIFPELTVGVRVPFRNVASVDAYAGYRHRFTAYGISNTGGNDIFIGAGFTLFLRGGFVR